MKKFLTLFLLLSITISITSCSNITNTIINKATDLNDNSTDSSYPVLMTFEDTDYSDYNYIDTNHGFSLYYPKDWYYMNTSTLDITYPNGDVKPMTNIITENVDTTKSSNAVNAAFYTKDENNNTIASTKIHTMPNTNKITVDQIYGDDLDKILQIFTVQNFASQDSQPNSTNPTEFVNLGDITYAVSIASNDEMVSVVAMGMDENFQYVISTYYDVSLTNYPEQLQKLMTSIDSSN